MTQIQKQIETKTENSIQTEKNQKKAARFRLNLKIINRVVLFFIVTGGVAYLLCVNDLSIKGIKMNELKKEKSRLTLENNHLELDIMNYKSYSSITARAKELSFVPAGKTAYIKADSALVVNR